MEDIIAAICFGLAIFFLGNAVVPGGFFYSDPEPQIIII